MNMRKGSVQRRGIRRTPETIHLPLFTNEWALASLDRFERVASGDALGPANLRASGISQHRIRSLYPFAATVFTPSYLELVEDPIRFKALRRSMHPLRTTRENDMESAEQYHWATYYREPNNHYIVGEDLMLAKEDTSLLAERMAELYGDQQNSLAKLTLLSRTLHMIPVLLERSQEPTVSSRFKKELQLTGVEQRPHQYMRGAGRLNSSQLRQSTEQLLSLLEGSVAQPMISLKAEM